MAKNIYFPGEITDEQRKEIANNKKRLGSGTIDNGSTTTEIIYLSKVYNVTREKKYKQATLKGIKYILKAQYENGGLATILSECQRLRPPYHL